MVYKVDGGDASASRVKTENPVIKKPEVKQNIVRRENSPTNAAVHAKGSEADQRAAYLQYRTTEQTIWLTGGLATSATTPVIPPEQAASRADEIINNNGGKDDLNTAAAGQQLAEIAVQNPSDAQLVAEEIYSDDLIEGGDRDEIAQSFTRALSDAELGQVANSAEGRALLKQIEINLNDNPVHEDEAADASRIRLALDEHGIFLGSDQGIQYGSVNPVSTAQDPDAAPEEVASFIKMNPSSYGSQTDRYAYLDALQAHQNDAEWLSQFHSALGSELAGRLIADTLDPATHQMPGGYGTDPESPLAQVELVRSSLETMAANGDLTQEGMNALIGEMRTNPYIATELFGNANDELKTMFINGAVNNGDDSWDAGALHVLNTMPAYRQEQILNGLGEKLNPFIEGAMVREEQIFSFSNQVEYGTYGTTANEDQLTKITYGGVERLLETANKTEVYYHARVAVPSFSENLQRNLFNAVSQGLNNPAAFGNFDENTNFEDQLSSVFIRNRDALLFEAQKGANDVNAGHINDNFENGLEKFFQIALLTPPNGERYEDLSGSIFQFINEGVTALSDPALANRDQTAFDDFVEKYGMEPTQYARVLGGVLGSVMDATGYAQESINADNAQKEATIKFFTGLAFAMIPGAGSHIASGVGNQIFKHFVEKGVGYFQSQGQGNIQSKINDLISGSFDNSDDNRATTLGDLVLSIFDEGLRSLPSGASINGNAAEEQFDFQEDFFDGFINTSQFTRLDNATGN